MATDTEGHTHTFEEETGMQTPDADFVGVTSTTFLFPTFEEETSMQTPNADFVEGTSTTFVTHTFEEETGMQTPNADFLGGEGTKLLHTQFPDVDSDEYDHLLAVLSAAAFATTALDEPCMAIAAAALAAATLEEMHMAIAAFALAIANLKESDAAVAAAVLGMAAPGEGEADSSLTESDDDARKQDDDQPRGLSMFQHALEATPAGTKRKKEESQGTEMSTLPQVEDTLIARVGQLTRLKAYQQASGIFLTMSEIEEENSGDTTSSRLPNSGNKDSHEQSPGEDSGWQTKAAGQPPSEYAGINRKNPEKLLIPTTGNIIASTLNRSENVGTKSMDTLLETSTSSRTKAVNSRAGHNKKGGSLTETRGRKIDADEWDKERMARIGKRYEKQKSRILSWENKKLLKAKRWLERTEMKLQLQRERITQKYSSEREKIDKIAGGARVIAGEKKGNDESKIRARAKKIRSTGKVPWMCFGF